MANRSLIDPVSSTNVPHEFFVQKALEAINKEFGPVYNDLSEEVGNVLYDACVASAKAALEAAKVSNNWADFVNDDDDEKDCTCGDRKYRLRPQWECFPIHCPHDLYEAMAWTAQEREFPDFFCGCKGFTNHQFDLLHPLISFMIRFALTAAGVDEAWDKLFDSAMAKTSSWQKWGTKSDVPASE